MFLLSFFLLCLFQVNRPRLTRFATNAKRRPVISLRSGIAWVSNHQEVKLVGYRKRYAIPADTIAIKKIYDNDRAYTGYNYGANGRIKVKLVRIGEVYGTQATEVDNGKTTVMSFGSKPEMAESLAQGLQVSVHYYDLVYRYKGKEVVLPALCSRGGYKYLVISCFFRYGIKNHS